MKCNEIIELFPDILKNPLQAAKVDLWETEEIRVRAGQCLSVRVRGREWRLEVRYTVEEIRQILSYLANYSLYAYEREIRQGYLTLPGGHRLGLVGRAVLEGDRITSLMEISALNLRLAHEKKGCADSVISCCGSKTTCVIRWWCHRLAAARRPFSETASARFPMGQRNIVEER